MSIGGIMDESNEEAEVISTKDWLITLIISAIPVVNIIMFFIWAFGDQTNPNKANWAKASLLWMVIVTGLVILLYVLIAVVIFGIAASN